MASENTTNEPSAETVIKPGPRRYDETQNPSGAYLPGVPLRDLSAEEFAEFPEHMQRSIDAAPFYHRSTPSAKASKALPSSETKEA